MRLFLKDADFEAFDWILCADRANVRDVLRLAPAARRERVALLLEWAGIRAGGEVPDPYTGGPDDFQRVWRLVDSAAQAVVARLSRPAGTGIIGA